MVSNKSGENGNDDIGMEIITIDEDEDLEEEEDDDDDEPYFTHQTFPASIVYLEGEQQRKNHKFITITQASPEEQDEEIDIEDSADSDIEEIGVIENEPIEILDDDDDDGMVIPDEKQNHTESVQKITNGEKEVEKAIEKHDVSSDSTSIKTGRKTPEDAMDTDDCIIVTPGPKISLKPIQELIKPVQKVVEKQPTPQFQKSLLIGGVVKKVLTAQDLKSGIIPMRSILNKDIIRGVKPVKMVANNIIEKRNQLSLLKPISIGMKDKRDQHSLLKPVTTEPKSLLKPELIKERRDSQSILKSVKSRGDILVSHQGLRTTITKQPKTRTAVCCSHCSSVFGNEKELREHMHSEHSRVQLKESPGYSPAAILELERELKDQSGHCNKCHGGLWYLPTLRTHAQIHPTGQNGCEACEHGMGIVKKLIAHLEAHVDIIDSD